MYTYFHYQIKGKTVSRRIPLNNTKLPKTKRLRKKKFWFYCVDCKQWLKRNEVGRGTLKNGNFICTKCLAKYIKK